MISTNDIRWLAGWLEGEGCFSSNTGMPVITVGCTDYDVACRGSKLLGKSMIQRPQAFSSAGKPYKTCYVICLVGRGAAGWMMTLYSLMGQRRQAKIREVLAIWKARPAHMVARAWEAAA